MLTLTKSKQNPRGYRKRVLIHNCLKTKIGRAIRYLLTLSIFYSSLQFLMELLLLKPEFWTPSPNF
jgi:hypothetical protein